MVKLKIILNELLKQRLYKVELTCKFVLITKIFSSSRALTNLLHILCGKVELLLYENILNKILQATSGAIQYTVPLQDFAQFNLDI